MARPSAPSMPTPHQISEAQKTVSELYPGVRIKSVGPGGVVFEYADQSSGSSEWNGKSFSAE